MASNVAEALKKANSGKEITLPVSGVQVRVRPVSLPVLVARGVMPSELLRQALSGFPDLDPKDEGDSGKLADAFMQVYNFECAILKAALVDPVFVADDEQAENPTDSITYSDLIPEDKDAIVGLCQTPIMRWERFLQEQGERLLTLHDSENAESEAE